MNELTKPLKVYRSTHQMLQALAKLEQRDMIIIVANLVEREHALRFSTPNSTTKLADIDPKVKP